MISTRDEIIQKFAEEFDDLSDIDPLRFPKTVEELKRQEGEEIDPERFPKTVEELARQRREEVSVEPAEPVKPPISQREMAGFTDPYEERGLVPNEYAFGEEWPDDPRWKEPERGSATYMAVQNPKEYLRGLKRPYRGYVRDPSNDEITKVVMDKLVANEPENYFKWELRERHELKSWMVPSAKKLVEEKPLLALGIGVHEQGPEIEKAGLLVELWKNAINAEFSENPSDMFPGIYSKHMQSLAGKIARTNPEFYKTYIFGDMSDEDFYKMPEQDIMMAHQGKILRNTKFRPQDVARFDNWAANALRDQ